MSLDPALKQTILDQAQGAASLGVAYVGVAAGLLDALASGPLTSRALAAAASVDAGYCAVWCDAAFAFGLVDEHERGFTLTPLGSAFVRAASDSMFPVAVGAILGAHMAERAAALCASGERPGERVLEERESIVPLFGPMLERSFAPLFASEIAPNVPVFGELDQRGGLAVDLGCGNGWYLRALAARFPGLRGVGLDGIQENVDQARRRAGEAGLAGRLEFRRGDLRHFSIEEPVDLLAMNRALHHVWEAGRREVFQILRDHLAPGGAAVIWEPAWPSRRADLRGPAFRMMALQNLSEHVQGNHFLEPREIEDAFRDVGMEATTHLFRGGAEAVIVGRRR